MAGISSRPSTPSHPVRCSSYVSNTTAGPGSSNNGYHPPTTVGNNTLSAVTASPSHLSHINTSHSIKVIFFCYKDYLI